MAEQSPKRPTKLAEAMTLVHALVPVVKSRGTPEIAKPPMPMGYVLRAHGLTLRFSPSVKQHPQQAIAESLLDVWLEGHGKVFSAAWSVSMVNGFKVINLRRGDWMTVALNLVRPEASNA